MTRLLLTLAALLALAAPAEAAPLDIDRAHGEARGVVLSIHGGGWLTAEDWHSTPREMQASMTGDLRSYDVVYVDYAGGPDALGDVVDAFDRIKRRWPRKPICAAGFSAGGQLALMLSVRRPRLACVVDYAGPPDLLALGDRAEGGLKTALDAWWNQRQRRRLSPLHRADEITDPVLIGAASCDPIIPLSQQRKLRRALPRARLVPVAGGEGGDAPGHCVTDQRESDRLQARRKAFLRRHTR